MPPGFPTPGVGRIGSSVAIFALGLAFLAAPSPATAQFETGPGGSRAAENIEGFTVSGKSTVMARPNLIEVDLEVSAASELSADAIVKYRDARRRIKEAFAALKLDNIAVEERGLLVDQKGMAMNPYFFNGMSQGNQAKAEVQLSRKLVVKATDIRKLDEDALLPLVAKLLDVAQDAGAKIGSQNNMNPYYYYRYGMSNSTGLVRFVIDDFDKLQEDAYEKAVADARARAQRLARLSGVDLGPIVAIREVSVPGDKPPGDDDESLRKRLETSKFQEIPIRVELLVRFDVRPPQGKARAADK